MEDAKARSRQGADPPRGGPPDHPRHADRGRAAGGRPPQPAAGAGARRPSGIGAAWLDVSTGLFETALVAAAELPALLGRLDPAEILAPPGLALGDDEAEARARRCRRPRRWRHGAGSPRPSASPASTPSAPSRDAEAVAACLALDYVRATQAGKLPRLGRPLPRGGAGRLAMDAATRASLEITRARDGGPHFTLLARCNGR